MLLLLTSQEGIKAPKNSMSNDINRIMKGCYNQAWDLSYLSEWSTFFYNETKYPEIFLFSTNDILLKKILIETYSGNPNNLIKVLLTNNEFKQVDKIITRNSGENRIKPDFGPKPSEYFYNLIEKEKHNLQKIITIK